MFSHMLEWEPEENIFDIEAWLLEFLIIWKKGILKYNWPQPRPHGLMCFCFKICIGLLYFYFTIY